MKHQVIGLAVMAAVTSLAWMGCVMGVEGARNLVQLFVWALMLPICLTLSMPAVQQHVAKAEQPRGVRWLIWPRRALWWAAIAIFGWHGYWATTAAMLVASVLFGAGSAAIEKLRSDASTFSLIKHLQRQIDFSGRTFGPGPRTEGVIDHIAKELVEVAKAEAAGQPTLPEWVDVIILGFDGAWRSGATPQQIIEAIVAKQTKNEGRKWPDWRTAPAGQAIEHDRSHDAPWEREGDAA